MFARRNMVVAATLVGVGLIAWVRSGSVAARGVAELRPDQEDVDLDGGLYTPSTQSFTRGHHLLDRMDRVEIRSDAEGLARLELRDPEGEHSFAIVNVPPCWAFSTLAVRRTSVTISWPRCWLMKKSLPLPSETLASRIGRATSTG